MPLWLGPLLTTLGLLAWLTGGCIRMPVGASAPATAASAPASPEQAVARHIAALGGQPSLQRIGQRAVEARTVFHPEKGCEASDEQCFTEQQLGSFYLYNTGDGRLYRRSVLGTFVDERGFDGQRGWKLQNGVLALDDEGQLVGSREDALLHWYFGIAERGIQLSLAGTRNQDHEGHDRPLDGVRWEHESGGIPPKVLWFDRQTGLLHEETIDEKVDGEPNRQVIVYDEYRPVDGVLIPHRVRLHTEHGKRSQLIEFVTQRVHHRMRADLDFRPPELAPPAAVPDGLLAQLAAARQAVSGNDKTAARWLEHARAAWVSAHFEEAEGSAKAVLRLDDDEPEAAWLLARTLILRGRLDEAERQLRRAEKLGVRGDAIAVQRAWIAGRRLQFPALAKAFEDAGSPAHAARFRSFAGRPLQLESTACLVELPLHSETPPTVEIRVGDRKTLAIVDTGAENLILASELAGELAIVSQGETSLGPGAPSAGYGQLPELGLGTAILRNIPIDLFPSGQLAQMAGEDPGQGAKVGAVLGIRVLERFQVTLDRARRLVTLVPRTPACNKAAVARRRGSQVPFFLYESHFVYVRAQMNGAEGLYLLNTGIRGAALTANANAFGHAAIGAPTLAPGRAAMVDVARFTVGDRTVEHLPAAWGYLQQDRTGDGFRLDGMIGLEAIPTPVMTLDFDEHRLYLGGGAR